MSKKVVLQKVTSLAGLARLARTDTNYAYWQKQAAKNLGWTERDSHTPEQWLNINASETTEDDFDGEQGVLDEVNSIRTMVQKELNSPVKV